MKFNKIFKSISNYVYRKLSGTKYASYRRNINYEQLFLSKCFIRDDGRVNLTHVETDIVIGCNLRCCQCSHLSPYRKGYVSTEKIVHWFETWSKKIRPYTLYIMGGEPFLHPDLAAVITETHRIWDSSALELVTNGLLIPQASQNIFDALQKTKMKVIISDHSSTDTLNEKIVAARDCLEKNGIQYAVQPSNTKWYVHHELDENYIPSSFQSIPKDAWSICMAKNCPSLANNRLYKCAVLAGIIESVGENALSASHWKDALTYNALSSEADANTIMEHFHSGFVKECSVCPDKLILTDAIQMASVFDVAI
jgi:organic radical activating enzyme